MTINRKDFDTGNFNAKHTDRKVHPIAVLLKENSHLAFDIKEIIKKTGMKEASVRSMLRNFQKSGLIVHKTPFFAWKEKGKSNNKSKRKR